MTDTPLSHPLTFGQLLFQAGMQTRAIVNRFETTDSSQRGFNCAEVVEQGLVDVSDIRDHWIYVPRWGKIYRCKNIEDSTLEPHSASSSRISVGKNTEFWLFRDTPLNLATAMTRTLAENTRLFTLYRDIELNTEGLGEGVEPNLDEDVGGTGGWRYLGGKLRLRIEGVEQIEAVYVGDASRRYLDEGNRGYPLDRWWFDASTRELALDYPIGQRSLTARCRVAGLSAAQILDTDVLSREWHDTYLGNFTVEGAPYEAGLEPSDVIYLVNLIEESYLGITKHGMNSDDALVAQRHQTSARNRAHRSGTSTKRRY